MGLVVRVDVSEGMLNHVQDVEPIPVLILGDPEKLFDGSIHSLGLPIGLGWKALDGRSLMLRREHSCSQKTDMNRASLSEIMDRGNPWYLTMCLMNWSAVSMAVASFQVGIKCVILVARSVTVSTLS